MDAKSLAYGSNWIRPSSRPKVRAVDGHHTSRYHVGPQEGDGRCKENDG